MFNASSMRTGDIACVARHCETSAQSGARAFALFCALLAAMCAVPAPAASIAAGSYHSLLLRDDGTLWAWGRNEFGQLGDGTTVSRSAPVQVLSGVRAVSAGYAHTLAIKTDNTLWAWGDNGAGQLGDGTTANRTTPVMVQGGVAAASGGGFHSMAITTDGTLLIWGSNIDGQLGDGTTSRRTVPVPLMGGVQAFAAGLSHSMAVKSDGTLWAWGSNKDGRLGDGTTLNRATPTLVLTGVRSVAAGAANSLAVKSDGSLWSWGYNGNGQLGDGTTVSRATPAKVMQDVLAIATAGIYTLGHSLALKTDNSLWAFGYNYRGQLGDGTRDDRLTPVPVLNGVHSVAAGSAHSLGLKADGGLWAWGENEDGQLGTGTTVSRSLPLSPLGDGRDVAGGSFHSLAITTNGTLMAWGSNFTGQLGDGTTIDRATPVAVLGSVQKTAAGGFFSFAHSMALKTDGTLWTWGDNLFGQLGDPSVFVSSEAPGQVLSGVQDLAAGASHSLAIKVDGSLWAWGYNANGQVGDGSKDERSTPVLVLTNARAVSGGGNHTLAIRTDGTLWAWGSNLLGQLGDGTTTDRTTPVQVMTGVQAVAAGNYHSLALKSDGTVWAWGSNLEGELGDGTTSTRFTPFQVLSGVQAIAAGDSHSLAVKADGTLWSWGGLAAPGNIAGPQWVPQQSPFLRNVVRVAAGGAHALAVSGDGRIMVWGDNSLQQLGIAHVSMSPSPIAVRDPQAPYADADLVVEYFNPTIRNGAGTAGIGHYFITAAPAEIASIDTGGSGPGWTRTGRTFRAWTSSGKAPAGAAGVCRFYARVPNSHFYTASAAECQSLKDQNPSNDPGAGWSYEGIAFHTVTPAGASCPSGYHPVYRSYNKRFNPNPALNDGNHRITPSYNDYQRSIRFLGFADEGIAFCSPGSVNPGGDLQATFSYPGATVQAGAQLGVEFLFGNNGAGRGDGASVYLALPAAVADWTVACTPRNGAACPATGNLNLLREGTTVAAWPAGGTLSFVARGTAPPGTTANTVVLDFAASVAGASGSPDSTPANDTPPFARTVVKSDIVCSAVPNPGVLQLGPASQGPHVSLVTGNSCPWSAQSDVSWIGVAPASGQGDAILTLSVAANPATASRSGVVRISGQTVAVTQAGAPAAPGSACDSMRLQREGDQVPATGFTGAQSFDVIADSRCAWQAQSGAPWITLTSGGGSGNGVVRYLVDPHFNPEPRTGTLSVGIKTFTINQIGSVDAGQGGDSGGDGGGGGSSGGGSSGGDAG